MRTKVLITGASGFVGRRITESLLEDRSLTIYALLRDPDKEKDLIRNDIYIYKGDITDLQSLKEPLSGKDIVVHCAALMSNFDSQMKEKFYEINAIGTKNLLQSCTSYTLKQFLYISTVGIYGSTGNTPVSEDTPYGKILSIYEWSKKEAELIVLKYAKEKNIPFTILRPSQLYGPGMRYGWPETIKSIKAGGMLVPGSGRAKIHLLNIEDFIRAVRLVLCNEIAINKIYNMAGPEVMGLGDVFYIISETLGVGTPKRIPYLAIYLASIFLQAIPHGLKNDRLRLLTPHRVRFFATNHIYDISKAKAELGYEPTINVRDGFHEMIKWCEKEGLI